LEESRISSARDPEVKPNLKKRKTQMRNPNWVLRFLFYLFLRWVQGLAPAFGLPVGNRHRRGKNKDAA
jgi:hypothetical protein